MPRPSVHDVHVAVAEHLSEDARRDVASLLERGRDADGFSSFSDQARLDMRDGRLETVAVLARVEPRPGGETGEPGAPGAPLELGGCALAVRRGGSWKVETVVHPAHRDGSAHVLGVLLDTALAEVATRGGGEVGTWLRAADAHTVAAARARGLEPSREVLQLRAPLPPGTTRVAGTPSVPVRPFRPGTDEDAWIAVNARAFAGHPEQGTWTRADLERREHEPWFDAGGFLLHEIGGRLAAFCWTKVHRNPVLGEIYVIGVDPEFQGRGLGRALTRAGLRHLAAQAVPTAMLYVEATNTAARALYRSLGFAEHHCEMLCTGTVPPAARRAGAAR